MPPPPEARRGELLRTTLAERWVHRSLAVIMSVCLLTAAVLYLGPLSVVVGRRALVEDIHVYSGIALPVPILLGWLSRSFRRDVASLNRFTSVDWAWLRSPDRRSGRLPVGKFNAGQKLNAAFVVGAILVMLGTGLLMRFANHWPIGWRTGATFVHDWLSYAVVAIIAGHLYFASRDPLARQGMRTGVVPESWARREHRAWADEAAAQRSAERSERSERSADGQPTS